MKHKLALFQRVESGFISPLIDRFDDIDGYVRLSEYVEIDFPELEQSEIINSQLNALDYAAAELGKKYMEGLESIKQKKSELLALEAKK